MICIAGSVIQRILADFLGGHASEVTSHPHHRLQILAARGSGLLKAPQGKIGALTGFGVAVVSNLVSRSRLAHQLERVVLGDTRDPALWIKGKFDAFDTHFAPLTPHNLGEALLASGTLPFVMEPVRSIADAPLGTYWDGGLIDYHLALPYSRVLDNRDGGLVLYPHFGRHIVPGWFDKQMPWRHAAAGGSRSWLDNVIVVSPSRAFLQTLPRGKLPDRNDFLYYGINHDLRILNWQKAIGEGARLRDAFAEFIEKPDPAVVLPLF